MREEIEKLKNKIKDFENKDVFLSVNGTIKFDDIIENAKFLIDNKFLIITDTKNKNYISELSYLHKIKFKDYTINILLENDIEIELDM